MTNIRLATYLQHEHMLIFLSTSIGPSPDEMQGRNGSRTHTNFEQFDGLQRGQRLSLAAYFVERGMAAADAQRRVLNWGGLGALPREVSGCAALAAKVSYRRLHRKVARRYHTATQLRKTGAA
jgi:hypothetical protein